MAARLIPKNQRRRYSGEFQASVVADSANDVAILATDGLFRPSAINLGLRFQATGSNVQVYYTQADAIIATNLSAQSNVDWTSAGTCTAGNYLDDPNMRCPTALKFVFAGLGQIDISCG